MRRRSCCWMTMTGTGSYSKRKEKTMNIKNEIQLARSGCVEAQERLAWIYHIGQGTKKSEKKSFYWSCKAALTGRSPVSSYNLSISYFNGEGVAANDYKAFLWAKRSAKQEYAEGYFAVAVHYLYGYGTSRNIHAAISNFIKAWQSNNNPEAAKLLSKIYYNGDAIRKSFKKAFFWMSRAALCGGDSDVLYDLSLYYLDGIGIKKNFYKSFLWVHRSAQMGSVDGMLATGWHYLNGLGTDVNLELAEYWSRKTVENSPKCSKAFYNLGYIYYYEYRNHGAAYEFFSQAYAIDRHVASAYMLARLLTAGEGIPVNQRKAKCLLKYAAIKGNSKARRLLYSKYWKKTARQVHIHQN